MFCYFQHLSLLYFLFHNFHQEAVKLAKLKKKKKELAKQGLKYVPEDDEEENEEDTGGKKMKIVNPKIVRIKVSVLLLYSKLKSCPFKPLLATEVKNKQ